jgi:hypothetical protein
MFRILSRRLGRERNAETQRFRRPAWPREEWAEEFLRTYKRQIETETAKIVDSRKALDGNLPCTSSGTGSQGRPSATPTAVGTKDVQATE